MAEEPVALGQRLARGLRGIGGCPEARLLAQRMGVPVVEQDDPPRAQPGLRSEYRSAPPRIILYRSALERLSEALSANGRLRCDPVEVHIAHELFHYLEEEEELDPLSREAAEEAAHAFTQSLLGLSFDPSELTRLGR
jgi:hypothetical protein